MMSLKYFFIFYLLSVAFGTAAQTVYEQVELLVPSVGLSINFTMANFGVIPYGTSMTCDSFSHYFECCSAKVGNTHIVGACACSGTATLHSQRRSLDNRVKKQ